MRTATVLSMVVVLGTANLGYAQQGAPDGAWPAYGGDAGSTKYSALDQINADNVDHLQVARQCTPSDAAVLSRHARGRGFARRVAAIGHVRPAPPFSPGRAGRGAQAPSRRRARPCR